MRTRALLAVASALLVGAASQASATKIDTLDGKKVKKVVSITQTRQTTKDNLTVGDPTDAQVLSCQQGITCNKLDFIYKPAKGVNGDITVYSYWYFLMTTDVDIYLTDGKTLLGRCGGEQGNVRHFDVPASALKSGKKYTAIAWFSHSSGEGLTLEVDMPKRVVPKYEVDGYPAPSPVPAGAPHIPSGVRLDGGCA